MCTCPIGHCRTMFLLRMQHACAMHTAIKPCHQLCWCLRTVYPLLDADDTAWPGPLLWLWVLAWNCRWLVPSNSSHEQKSSATVMLIVQYWQDAHGISHQRQLLPCCFTCKRLWWMIFASPTCLLCIACTRAPRQPTEHHLCKGKRNRSQSSGYSAVAFGQEADTQGITPSLP